MGAPFPEPPGHAASTYRSDQMAFATAKVPDRALAAKAFVETHYRGADFLGARGAPWNASTATRPEPLRGMRRDEAFAKCLSTTRDGLRNANETPRPFGFGGDPLGATVRRTTTTLKNDSDASAAREASRRETVYDARARLGRHERRARRGTQEYRVREAVLSFILRARRMVGERRRLRLKTSKVAPRARRSVATRGGVRASDLGDDFGQFR